MDSPITTELALTPREAIDRLRGEIQQRGLVEYALIDHAHDMAQRGAVAHDAFTLIFGNPVAGSALLKAAPDAVGDIPLRVGVIARSGGCIVAYRSVGALGFTASPGSSFHEVASKIDALLALLVESLLPPG